MKERPARQEAIETTVAFLAEFGLTMDIIFEVRDSEDGGYSAKALTAAIFTQADTWDELREKVREATALHFEDSPECPKLVQLHYVRDELLVMEAA